LNETPGPSFERRCHQLHALTAGLRIPSFGRLHNRLKLVSVAHGICGRSVSGDDDSCLALMSSDWESLLQDLQDLKANMLRMDHNDVRGDKNARLDEDLEQLPIFSESHDEVVSLYKLQITICQFREALQQLMHHPGSNVFNRQLEQVLADYKAGIPDDLKAGDLLTFVQNDLLKAGPQKSNAKRNATLLEKLLTDLNSAMTTKPDAEYSYQSVQLKSLELLKDWYGSNLKVPELVLLGYGGLPPLQHTDANDKHTVSSWGMDEVEREERRKIERDEPLDTVDEENMSDAAHAIDDSDDTEGFYTATSGLDTQQITARIAFPDSDTDVEDVPEEQQHQVTSKHQPDKVPATYDDFSDVELSKERTMSEDHTEPVKFPVTQVDDSDTELEDEVEVVKPPMVSRKSPANAPAKPAQSTPKNSPAANLSRAIERRKVTIATAPVTTRTTVVPGSMVMDEEDVVLPSISRDAGNKTSKTQRPKGMVSKEGNDDEHVGVVQCPDQVNTAGSEEEDDDEDDRKRASKKRRRTTPTKQANKTSSAAKSPVGSFTHYSDDEGQLGRFGQAASRKRHKIRSTCYDVYSSPPTTQKSAVPFDAQKEAIRLGYETYGELWSTVRANSKCLQVLKVYQIKAMFAQMLESGEIIERDDDGDDEDEDEDGKEE
jgi:hypothetical protein